jgi:hypothetical protein
MDFSEISEGRRVKCFQKFPKGGGLNRLRKFTGQGTCFHIHSEAFLGNMRCFWDSVHTTDHHHLVVSFISGSFEEKRSDCFAENFFGFYCLDSMPLATFLMQPLKENPSKFIHRTLFTLLSEK